MRGVLLQAERRIEISATVSEAVANSFEKKALPKEGLLVVPER
jgi:hypothetical protein